MATTTTHIAFLALLVLLAPMANAQGFGEIMPAISISLPSIGNINPTIAFPDAQQVAQTLKQVLANVTTIPVVSDDAQDKPIAEAPVALATAVRVDLWVWTQHTVNTHTHSQPARWHVHLSTPLRRRMPLQR